MNSLDRGPMGILLVEDDDFDAQAIERELAQKYDPAPNITVATTLKAALLRLGESTFALVLVDLNLPDSDGLATAERVLNAARDTPVVLLTGNDREELVITAVSLGAQDYVCKADLGAGILARVIKHSLEGIRSLLAKEDDIEAVGQVHSVNEGIEAVEQCQPDLAVVELPLVDSHGMDSVRYLATYRAKIKILV